MPGQFGPIRPRFLEVYDARDAHHVERGNAFGDADREREPCVGGFEDGVGSVRRRNENHGSVCAGGFRGVGNSVEDGALEMFRSAFCRE